MSRSFQDLIEEVLGHRKVLATFAASLVILWALAFLTRARPIQRELAESARMSLAKITEFTGVEVEFSGRDAILSGDVPTAEARTRAKALVEGITGVRKVRISKLTVGSNRPSALQTNDERPPAGPNGDRRPAFLRFEARANQLVVLGELPGSDVGQSATNVLMKLYPDFRLVDLTTPSALPGPSDWILNHLRALEKVGPERPEIFETKGATNVQAIYVIPSGSPPANLRERVREALPDYFQVRLDVAAPDDGDPGQLSAAERRVQAVLDENMIYFGSNSRSLDQTNVERLMRIVAALKLNPYKVVIRGHTDATGPAEINRTVSKSRAEIVRNELISQGIPASRLESRGLGPDEPIADNSSPEGRARNRRVDFRIVPGPQSPGALP